MKLQVCITAALEGVFIEMKYYLEVLDIITLNDIQLNTKVEFSTKAKAKSALAKKEINSKQKKRIHLCTHDEDKNKPCEIING